MIFRQAKQETLSHRQNYCTFSSVLVLDIAYFEHLLNHLIHIELLYFLDAKSAGSMLPYILIESLLLQRFSTGSAFCVPWSKVSQDYFSSHINVDPISVKGPQVHLAAHMS